MKVKQATLLVPMLLIGCKAATESGGSCVSSTEATRIDSTLPAFVAGTAEISKTLAAGNAMVDLSSGNIKIDEVRKLIAAAKNPSNRLMSNPKKEIEEIQVALDEFSNGGDDLAKLRAENTLLKKTITFNNRAIDSLNKASSTVLNSGISKLQGNSVEKMFPELSDNAMASI